MPRKPIGERALTDAERARRYRDRKRGLPPLPVGARFGVIYADPPWHWRAWLARGEGRSAGNHYPVMDLRAIKALPVRELAADNCALLLWATSPMLPQALEVMAAWGFRYKTVGFTWAKRTKHDRGWHMGGGLTATRANPEFCLLGTRGAPKRLAHDVRQLIVAPVAEHSRKPAEVYERIERLYPGPHLELFARPPLRSGWTAWGNEVAAAAIIERRAA